MKKSRAEKDDPTDEVSALIKTLLETGQRLEALTAGEVDSVADREGRTFVLQHAQEQLRHSEAAKQAAILNALPAHIALLDTRGWIISVNEAWRRFSGSNAIQRPGHAIGVDYLAICDGAEGEARQVADGIRSVLSGGAKSFSLEYPCHEPTAERWFVLTVTPLAEDRPNGAVVMQMNITEEKKAKEELRELALLTTHSAEHDFLTGLPNRMLLNDRVGQAIAFARRHTKQVALLFMDLDGFKHINDSLGHAIGDKLLQSIAKRLVECVRGSDTVSRQGGDEFVVLLSEVSHPEDAAISARRILKAVAQPHSIGQHELHVTASIGVSVYPDDGRDAETLTQHADTAMYQAKENGRRSYQFFKPSMNVRAVERQFIEEGLRGALERHEFALDYQPKIDLRTGAIAGAEALLRWTHPARGTISAAQFVSVAEDCGLIVPISQWALREACEQARAWLDAGLPPVALAVNVSAMELRDENFVESIFAVLTATGVDTGSLELELTENVLMKRSESTAPVLQALRARGVRVVIDAFGTGYSSLSYLQNFPIDTLKIDRSFVHQITAAPAQTSIVAAVINMGQNLKLRVAADGVETREEFAFLQAHRCDEAQGSFFSAPVRPEEFARLLSLRATLPAIPQPRGHSVNR
ncbi:MAG TPA: EAL domain-containing protein [Burkholderiales bacterium]|nr:EAL domain-containing protein [Burkholderiales bacterium]